MPVGTIKSKKTSSVPKLFLRRLIRGLLSLAVVALGPTLVADKLRVHTFGGPEALLLGALDTVAVRLVGLVTGRVILLFDHGCLRK
jgi:hypothetical protein